MISREIIEYVELFLNQKSYLDIKTYSNFILISLEKIIYPIFIFILEY